MEHHSNIVPWQMLCEETGAKLRVIPMNERGELILEEYEKLLNPRTKMVAFGHVSNALGTINPVEADDRDGAQRAGALDAGRRRAGRAAHEDGRAGAGRGFLHVLGAQGFRADGHRHSVRQDRSC